MNKLWLILSLTVILLSANHQDCRGQDEYNFLPDKEAYNQEINKFFDKYGSSTSKDLLKSFLTYTDDVELEENEWISIAEISNNITARLNNRYLYMSGFIEAIVSFKNNPDRLSNFQVWSQHVNKILQGESKRLKPLSDFFIFTKKLHEEKIISGSSNINWKISSPDYRFLSDGDFLVQTGKINLTGVAGSDSSRIQSTSGKYYPSKSSWAGNGGRISWEKTGIDNNLVYVTLEEYDLDLSKSVYTIDSIELNDQRNFNYPLKGKFEDKISIGVRPERSGYPRFTSYDTNHRIKSIFPDMDYEGGYSLEGTKIIGSGSGMSKGELMVFKRNKPIMQLNSSRFVFDEDGAKGLNTMTKVFLGADSIIHPGLFFQYKKNKNELVLLRDGTGASNSKFFDSFHQMALDVKMLSWSPGDSLLYLSGMRGSMENDAVFESADFFSIQWFNEIMLADKKNPLLLVKQCADHFNSRFYYSSDLANFMEKPLNLVEEMILNVSYLGFVRYNTETNLIEVLQRTYDFLQQHAGLMDYDIIKFNSFSEPPNPNAIISLDNGKMKFFGVKEISLSNSRSVKFIPDRQTLTIDKGRDMKFDGTVEAGLMTFTGTNFEFVYEDFLVNMDTVDEIHLKVHIPLVRDYLETEIANVSSIIEDTRGVLQIDAPNNKAGLEPEDSPQFPLFRFDTTAYVYYDQKFIQNGAYTRDSFFFEISPNTLPGLNDVRFRENLFFPGTFKTYNIFPSLELDLFYRDDNSLGFDTFYTPEEGYPVYIDRGTFFNEISMNNSGLRGKGSLTYLGSTIESENFLFLPDRALIEVQDVVVDKNSSAFGNPEIMGQNLMATWSPLENSLMFDQQDEPLILYGNGEFTGKLFIEPESIHAAGSLIMPEFTASSDDLIFMEERVDMNDGQLKIHTKPRNKTIPSENDIDFIGNHISGAIDLKNRLAEFAQTDDKVGELIFPVNKYTSDDNSFIWDMDSSIISLNPSLLTSSKKEQNSLSFRTGNSVYDINSYTITANNVPWIDVADVRIFPGTEQIIIHPDAVIDSLSCSRIISSNSDLGHEFINSKVFIRGKNNYTASGQYLYHDISGQELNLAFEEIGARSGKPSEGKAKVDTISPFSLSPEFKFIGDVEWNNNNRLLNFKGSYSLTQDCPGLKNYWVRLNTEINPLDVIIPVDSLSRSYDGEVLRQGFFLSNQPISLYPAFLGPHMSYTDHPVISTFGQISFDYSKNQYIIQQAPLNDSISVGPTLTLDRNTCITKAKGKLDLGVKLEPLQISTTGTIQHNIANDSILSDQIMLVDFFLDDKLLDIFADKLNEKTSLQPVDYSRENYKTSLIDLLGKEKGQELLNELTLMGGFRRVPDEFRHTLFLTDLKMRWNSDRGSYQSVGKIGIGNIDNRSVNKLVDGHLEIVKSRGGDSFTFYVAFDTNSYFFFYYNRGVMQVLAGPTFEEFNNRIRDIKPKKRRLKTKSGPRYEYALGQYGLVRSFLNAINDR